MNKQIRILIVDDHPVVREGLVQLIGREPDFCVCGEIEEADKILESVQKLKPHLLILDLILKDKNAFEQIKILREQFAELKILVLSMQDETIYAERAIRSGANGYLIKNETPRQIITALRKILDGDLFASEQVKNKLLNNISSIKEGSSYSNMNRLSDRELEVLRLLGLGYSTKRIALEWNRSPKTIEEHRERIKKKLNLANASELLHFAVHWVAEGR